MVKAIPAAGLLVCASVAASGQEAAAAPATEFEAASVKPAAPSAFGFIGCRTPDPGRLECTGAAFRTLLRRAYQFENYRLFGPGWMDTERYDIAAKVPAGTTKEQVNLMLQALLAGRFGLTVHRETRDLPQYVLTVGKGGPKLTEWKVGETLPRLPGAAVLATGADAPSKPPERVRFGMGTNGTRMECAGIGMSTLATYLGNQLNGAVVDETGLKGFYNLTLSFAADHSDLFAAHAAASPATGDSPAAEAAPEPIPSIFSAVQTQLGLKLDVRKVPTEVLVVDKAEKVPSAN